MSDASTFACSPYAFFWCGPTFFEAFYQHHGDSWVTALGATVFQFATKVVWFLAFITVLSLGWSQLGRIAKSIVDNSILTWPASLKVREGCVFFSMLLPRSLLPEGVPVLFIVRLELLFRVELIIISTPWALIVLGSIARRICFVACICRFICDVLIGKSLQIS